MNEHNENLTADKAAMVSYIPATEGTDDGTLVFRGINIPMSPDDFFDWKSSYNKSTAGVLKVTKDMLELPLEVLMRKFLEARTHKRTVRLVDNAWVHLMYLRRKAKRDGDVELEQQLKTIGNINSIFFGSPGLKK